MSPTIEDQQCDKVNRGLLIAVLIFLALMVILLGLMAYKLFYETSKLTKVGNVTKAFAKGFQENAPELGAGVGSVLGQLLSYFGLGGSGGKTTRRK